jgi:acyl-coenzyme A thioesterase 13
MMDDNARDPQDTARELLAAVPFADVLAMRLIDVSNGSAVFALTIQPAFLQNHGVLHGGVIASLIDTAAAFSVSSLLQPGETTTTIDLTIHYLAAVTEGEIVAKSEVVRAGRKVVILSIQVHDDKDNLVATATSAFLRRRPPVS